MEEERNDHGEKVDEVMLPGFRFHPTDEELVGFYLKRKIQQRPLSVELIKQLDIYKYDPWDLPKLAGTGEKEWYFYCPRDRKYRNSARPNRVTGAGFWKATGTDRPIYSLQGSKCIGLKKSLVFYKGRAAKGVKTDWMMHEFRLPSLTDPLSPKKYIEKTIPANESWAICRIFKKINSTAQRVQPQYNNSWVTKDQDGTQFCSSSNMPLTNKTNNDIQHLATSTNCNTSSLCHLDVASSYRSIINPLIYKTLDNHLPLSNGDLTSLLFSSHPLEASNAKSTMDVSSMLLNMSSISVLGDLSETSDEFTPTNLNGGLQEQCSNGYPIIPLLVREKMQYDNVLEAKVPNANIIMPCCADDEQDQLETVRSVGFPFSTVPFFNNSIGGDAWKSDLLWDISSCPPSDACAL